MSERHPTLLQINDLHGYLEPHPGAFRGRGKFNFPTCGEDGKKLPSEFES